MSEFLIETSFMKVFKNDSGTVALVTKEDTPAADGEESYDINIARPKTVPPSRIGQQQSVISRKKISDFNKGVSWKDRYGDSGTNKRLEDIKLLKHKRIMKRKEMSSFLIYGVALDPEELKAGLPKSEEDEDDLVDSIYDQCDDLGLEVNSPDGYDCYCFL